MDEKAIAENLMKQGTKELNRSIIWGGPNYSKAAYLYEEAGLIYRKSKLWVQLAMVAIELAEFYIKLNKRNYAAFSFVDGAEICLSAKNENKAISCYDKAVREFENIGYSKRAATYCEKIGQLHEKQQNIPMAVYYFEQACDHFQHCNEEASADECSEKVKQLRTLYEQEV
ncbi:hypothetical protein MKW92_039874 [Papaver armeniacum]|nr:hypothetical protein MKW92_039874 [Papaver armeniacum]